MLFEEVNCTECESAEYKIDLVFKFLGYEDIVIADKSVLGRVSTAFEEMFTGMEQDLNEVYIAEFEPKVFAMLIR